MDDLLHLEKTLGVPINDYSLLAVALTHRSYLNENTAVTEDNERLEFLGDAVLDLIVADYLYQNHPAMPEGEMTALRSALVRAESLAKFARQLQLDTHLRLGYGEDEGGGRNRTAILCATFEAVLGAIYLDAGMSSAAGLVHRLIQPALVKILAESLHKDARSEFQMWAQATFNSTPRYEVISVTGPDHEREFTVSVNIDGRVWGEGQGRSKQIASQAAAAVAWQQIEPGKVGAHS